MYSHPVFSQLSSSFITRKRCWKDRYIPVCLCWMLKNTQCRWAEFWLSGARTVQCQYCSEKRHRKFKQLECENRVKTGFKNCRMCASRIQQILHYARSCHCIKLRISWVGYPEISFLLYTEHISRVKVSWLLCDWVTLLFHCVLHLSNKQCFTVDDVTSTPSSSISMSIGA